MFVKLAAGGFPISIHLVDNIHSAIPSVQIGIVIDKEVEMVTVLAFLAQNIAIGVMHLLLPLRAIAVCSSTHTALRVLYSEVIATKLHMSLTVVACLLLSLRWLSIGVHYRIGKTICKHIIPDNLMIACDSCIIRCNSLFLFATCHLFCLTLTLRQDIVSYV